MKHQTEAEAFLAATFAKNKALFGDTVMEVTPTDNLQEVHSSDHTFVPTQADFNNEWLSVVYDESLMLGLVTKDSSFTDGQETTTATYEKAKPTSPPDVFFNTATGTQDQRDQAKVKTRTFDSTYTRINLDVILDTTFKVTAEQCTGYKFRNLVKRILEPIGQSYADALDLRLLTVAATGTGEVSFDSRGQALTVDPIAVRQELDSVHATLVKSKIRGIFKRPGGNFFMASDTFGDKIELTRDLVLPGLVQDGGELLRNSYIAPISGWDIFRNGKLDEYFPELAGIGFKQDAILLLGRSLPAPEQEELAPLAELVASRETFSYTSTGDGELAGLNIRLSGWYDGYNKSYYMSVDCWMGVGVLDNTKIVRVMANGEEYPTDQVGAPTTGQRSADPAPAGGAGA